MKLQTNGFGAFQSFLHSGKERTQPSFIRKVLFSGLAKYRPFLFN